jgi:hypothetical protein
LVTVFTGWYFWKRTGEKRLCRVEPELPTVRGGLVYQVYQTATLTRGGLVYQETTLTSGGLVYLVKVAECDPKELAETSAGVRQAALDPIVPQARLLPV